MDAGQTRIAQERRQFGAPAMLASEAPENLLRNLPPPAPIPAPILSRLFVLVPDAGAATLAIRRAFAQETERGNLFLFAPVFMAAGALGYFTMQEEPDLVLLLSCLVVAGVVAAASLSRPAVHAFFLALSMAFAGMLAGKVETLRAATPMLGAEISTKLTARVVRVEHQASGRFRLTLDVMETERPTLRYAPARVRATARAIPDAIAPGDTVQGVVRLLPPSGPVRPGSYDFSFESYFSGIGAVGFFLTNPQRIHSNRPATLHERTAASLEGWRSRMAAHIGESIGGPEGAIAAALITGVRAGIPEELNEAMRVTGLYHVISISGLHMALVAGTLMVSLRAGFALFPAFAMRRPVKKYAAAAALLATGFYLAISGGDVAAQRSFIMLAVMLLAVLFDRAALTMRNLAISALIILVVAPHEVVGPSFQMSFAATAALVAAYAGWREYRETRTQRSTHRRSALSSLARGSAGYAAGLAMTSIVAGLATALFTAWHFQQVSPLGLAANLAAMPFVSVVVMPMAVLASLMMPLGLDAAPLWLMGQGIAAMNVIAYWLADRSTLDTTGAIPLSAVLVLTVALAILTMFGTSLRWAALPLLGAGIGLLVMREIPDAFVSEDGRLMAVRTADGTIAVNRPRPRAFTMQNWQRAFGNGRIITPRKVHMPSPQSSTDTFSGYSCDSNLCIARTERGATIAHTATASFVEHLCGKASLVVIDDATAGDVCDDTSTTVITRRDLARWGSVEVRFHRADPAFGRVENYATLGKEENAEEFSHKLPGGYGADGALSWATGAPLVNVGARVQDIGTFVRNEAEPKLVSRADIRFAIGEPYRPWHQHRRFSREARGLAPYVRASRNASD